MPNQFSNIAKSFAEGNASHLQHQRAAIEHNSTVNLPFFWRFVILETIFDPTIIDDTKLDHWIHVLGVSNTQHLVVAPKNSIIARHVKGATASPADAVMVLYPFFPPNLSLPCQPGEHVWVMFEDPYGTNNDLGYWMCRIVGPNFVEDVNHTHAPRAYDSSFFPNLREQFEGTPTPVYEFRNGKVGTIDGERFTDAVTSLLPGGEDAYKNIMIESDAGKLCQYEPVPRYRKRPGDVVLEGSNNTLIALGRDRTGVVSAYENNEDKGKIPTIIESDEFGAGTGTIDIVAGRGQTTVTGGTSVQNDLPAEELGKAKSELVEAEGDPDFFADRSRIYVSERSNVDVNFRIDSFNATLGEGAFQGTASGYVTLENFEDGQTPGSIVVKSDKIRIIARSDIELLVSTFTRDENGRMIDVEDPSKWAAIVIKANGDIVLRPAEQGYVKLGGDDADKAIVCTDTPALVADGKVDAPPLMTTMGGQFAGTKITGQGTYATKLLVK